MEVPSAAPADAIAPVKVAEAAAAPEPAPADAAAPVAPAVPAALTFDSIEDARLHLLANARDKVVRPVENVRFHGKLIDKLPPGEIRRAVEGHVERQRRFPLDTANALRGRLRREGFTIFKKGSRGVSFVCAVKRRFRVPGQVFSESITALIDFLEKNPMVHVKDLPKNFLGIDVAAALAAAPVPEGTVQSQAPFAVLPPDQSERLRKMSNDLRWLVMEGYVTEFSDGKLFAAPPMAPQSARKAESGEDEHDPEDFPEAPAAPAALAPAPATDATAPASATETPPTHPPEATAEPVAPEAIPAAVEPLPVATESVAPVEEPKPEVQA
jgi:hypothetical protein